MSEKKQIRAIKGVRDILPPESALWNRVEQTARDVFETYNFGEIRLPIFEQTELFARSVGVGTDIVSKEMYTFADPPETYIEYIQKCLREMGHEGYRKFAEEDPDRLRMEIEERSEVKLVSLRPEATASVVRAYIEHGMHTWPQPVKLYYLGPMFRRERPQKGRYRQFYQIGAEVLGQSDHPAIDAEVMEMLMVFLARLKLEGAKLYINSIGCQECRPAYVERLRAELLRVKDKLGADSQRRIEANPLRVLDSKVPSEQAIIEKLPRIADHLCADCREHFARVQEQLKQRGIAFEINWRLVRGLDYYTRTTFEITAPGLGAQNAICGGGRYDGLVELLGGQATKGMGFAIGTDRLVLALQHQGVEMASGVDVLMAYKDEGSRRHAESLAWLLRDVGLVVHVPPNPMEPREGLGLASRIGIPVGVIIGPSEVTAGVFSVRLMSDRQQFSVGTLQAEQLRRLLVFRVLLEKALRHIAKRDPTVDNKEGPDKLLDSLARKKVVPGHLAPRIRQALEAFNRMLHGEKLSEDEQSRAVAHALFALQALAREFGPQIPIARYQGL